MPSGGKRPGQGRRLGSKNVRKSKRALVKAQCAELARRGGFTGNAVDFMKMIYCDHKQPLSLRMEAAKGAAPYESPRLSAVDVGAKKDSEPFVIELVQFKKPGQ